MTVLVGVAEVLAVLEVVLMAVIVVLVAVLPVLVKLVCGVEVKVLLVRMVVKIA